MTHRKQLLIARYVFALLITCLILIAGIFFGYLLEKERVDRLYADLKGQTLELQTLQTEQRFIQFSIEQEDLVSCEDVKQIYRESIGNLDETRFKLERYLTMAEIEEEEFFRIRDFYTNLQIDYFLLAKDINTRCNDTFKVIVYFYGDEDSCDACEDQGVHLDYVKRLYQDEIMVFAFDYERQNTAQMIKQTYGIHGMELPVMIINNELYGFMTKEEILATIDKEMK